jgi:hypothetical protein
MDGVRFSVLGGSGTGNVVNIDEDGNVARPGVFIYQVDGFPFPGGCSDSAGKALQ